MKIVARMFLIVGLLAVTGCYESTTVVELNSDGSGRIVESVYTPASLIKEAAAGGRGWRFNEEYRRDEAESMMDNYGKGISLDSVTEIKKADGSRGCCTVYRFEDITKLQIYLPTMLAKSHVTFAYTNGQLSVVMPDVAKEARRLDPDGDTFDSKRRGVSENELSYKTYRYTVLLYMPAEVKKTDATYPGSHTNRDDKSAITLVDINLADVLSDTKARAKFMSYELEPERYIATAKLLNGMPGVKYETNKVVSIPVLLAPSAETIAAQKLHEQRAKEAEKAFMAFYEAIRTGDYEACISFMPKEMIVLHPEILDKKEFAADSADFREEFVSLTVNKVVIKGDIARINATHVTKGKYGGENKVENTFKLTDGKWQLFEDEE